MIARAEIDRLTPQEKLLLLAEVWDSLASDDPIIPITDEEKALLERRWAGYLANPASALTQEEFERLLDERK
jgi:putative addiction module component (TIGR02574 family)